MGADSFMGPIYPVRTACWTVQKLWKLPDIYLTLSLLRIQTGTLAALKVLYVYGCVLVLFWLVLHGAAV